VDEEVQKDEAIQIESNGPEMETSSTGSGNGVQEGLIELGRGGRSTRKWT
jgi:hypothetical protein